MNTSTIKFLATCAATALLTMMLTACGGGGGGGGMTLTEPGRASIFRDTAFNAATARPNSGSVTQSSNFDENGITTDQIEVEVRYGGDSREQQHIFSVRNGTSWSIGSEDDDVSTHLENSGEESQFRGSGLKKRIGESGILSVALVTDIQGPDDTDYLTLGTWTIAPDNVDDSDNYEYGVFVDGSDPFEQTNIRPLQGDATYSGLAAGLFISGPNVVLNTDYGRYAVEDNFDGKLELRANFQSANDLGTISGSITELMVNGTLRDGTLNLGDADIGPRDSGFFEGPMSGSISDVPLSGAWGGQFYGNNTNDGKPGTVAGTFGGQSADDGTALIGVFLGDKE